MSSLASLLDRAATGGRLSFEEGVRLYREADLHDLGMAAHARRMQLHPTSDVTYVIDTTIDYTNVCNVHCTFCAFFRPEHHKEGRTLSHDQVLARVKYAADQGATQIMIQGGVNPDLPLTWYEELFARVRVEHPNVDIHSLSVSEITGLAKVENMTPRAVLERLKAAGLKSLPGRRRRDLGRARAQTHLGAQSHAERMARRHASSAPSGYAHDRDHDVRLDRDR